MFFFLLLSYSKMLRITWTVYRTNASILEELRIQENKRLLPSIQRQIPKFFGHIIRRDGLEKNHNSRKSAEK